MKRFQPSSIEGQSRQELKTFQSKEKNVRQGSWFGCRDEGHKKSGQRSVLVLTPGEIGDLIDAMHTIVSKVEGPKKAAETEKVLVKLFLKVYFQIQEKTLTIDQILDADKPLRAGPQFLTHSLQHV